jgi:hypothetical protein
MNFLPIYYHFAHNIYIIENNPIKKKLGEIFIKKIC